MDEFIEDVDGKLIRRTTIARVERRTRDSHVVDSGPLASILNEFIERWESVRPPNPSSWRSDGSYSPIDWLANETGLAKGTISNIIHKHSCITYERGPDGRYIRDESGQKIPRRVCDEGCTRAGRLEPRNKTTELRIADALVAAIGDPGVLCDGTLEPRPRRQYRR